MLLIISIQQSKEVTMPYYQMSPEVWLLFMAVSGVFILIMVAIVVWLYWRIFSKAGFSGLFSLLMLVPVINIITLAYLAFAEWPIQKRFEELVVKLAEKAPPQSIMGNPSK
jgi:hypothetical protein